MFKINFDLVIENLYRTSRKMAKWLFFLGLTGCITVMIGGRLLNIVLLTTTFYCRYRFNSCLQLRLSTMKSSISVISEKKTGGFSFLFCVILTQILLG